MRPVGRSRLYANPVEYALASARWWRNKIRHRPIPATLEVGKAANEAFRSASAKNPDVSIAECWDLAAEILRRGSP